MSGPCNLKQKKRTREDTKGAFYNTSRIQKHYIMAINNKHSIAWQKLQIYNSMAKNTNTQKHIKHYKADTNTQFHGKK